MLPEDAHTIAEGKLQISVTDCTTGANVLISSFSSREALLDSIWASCLIPRSFHPLDFFANSARTYPESEGMQVAGHQGHFVDGGISANIPMPPNHDVLRVSVLHGPSAPDLICRQEESSLLRLTRFPAAVPMSGLPVYLSLSNLRAGMHAAMGDHPTLQSYFQAGQRDGEEYLRNHTR